MSIFEDMKQIALDCAEIIELSGTTKATQGKQLTLTDIPTYIRNRCDDEEQQKILKLMQHRKDEREQELRQVEIISDLGDATEGRADQEEDS